VRIVNGAHRGATAQLLSLNVDEFCVAVKIVDGAHAGCIVERVEYEDVCKLDAS
jgi:DNA/RNA-binding protein KIN17